MKKYYNIESPEISNYSSSKTFDRVLLDEEAVKIEFVSCIYKGLLQEQTGDNFNNWFLDFTKIHGDLNSQREIDFAEVTKSYNIDCKELKDFFYFIYGLECFYSVLLKGLAAKVVTTNSYIHEYDFSSIIDCSYFRNNSIINYCSPAYYTEPIITNEGLKQISYKVLKVISDIEKPNAEFDYVKNLFESIFDSNVRHSLGEFYTPDWLAEFLIDKVAENANWNTSTFLDPTCGSGTFIVSVINKCSKRNINSILERVFGFDINPLSVLAAKTNFLIQYFNHHTICDALVIPIFNADLVNENTFPRLSEINYNIEELQFDFYGEEFKISECNDSFEHIKNEYKRTITDKQFEQTYTGNITKDNSDYYYLLDRIFSVKILNSQKKFDYITGNPPWVNWEYLPKKYKLKSAHIWQHYDLFAFKGMDSIFVKEDISVLITYIVIDKYLVDGGIIGFVLKETLLKSPKLAAGFRKFYLKPTNRFFNPIRIDDLTLFKPFPGINARVALMFFKKNEKVAFPVSYFMWHPTGKKSFKSTDHLSDIIKQFEFQTLFASPINSKQLNSNWIAQTANSASNNLRVLGKNDYKARTGTFTGGANGVYWVEILEAKGDLIKIRNIHEKAKNKVEEIIMWVEKEHVYPMLTGSSLYFWDYKVSRYLICPHNVLTKMYPVTEDELLKRTPLLKAYFQHFQTTLEGRKGFTSFDKEIHKKYFYAIQRVGEYTFRKYKVCWRYISKEFVCSVVQDISDKFTGLKNIVPNEKIIYVSFETAAEAYFLCGLLSSQLIRDTIHNFMVGTQIGPNIIENLSLPTYDDSLQQHRLISEICLEGHFSENKQEYIARLNNEVVELYKNNL